MDKDIELHHLAEVDSRISELREHVEHQRKLAEELPETQQQVARQILETSRHQLAVMERYRAEILRTIDGIETGRIPSSTRAPPDAGD